MSDPWLPPGQGGGQAPAGAPFGSAPAAGGAPGGRQWSAEAATAGLTTAGLVLLGAPAGAVWAWVSPKVAVVIAAGGPDLPSPETKAFIGADAVFLLVTAALGVLTGLLAWRLARRHTLGAVAGLAVGGVLAAVLAWQVGHHLQLGTYRALVHSAPVGTHLSGPVDVRARGVLLAWSLIAVLTLAGLVAVLDKPEQSETGRMPGWGGWAAPSLPRPGEHGEPGAGRSAEPAGGSGRGPTSSQWASGGWSPSGGQPTGPAEPTPPPPP